MMSHNGELVGARFVERGLVRLLCLGSSAAAIAIQGIQACSPLL
jgi:hypothetical protein